ncbi:hypothetical protein D3C72_1122400 [compost metagenome]
MSESALEAAQVPLAEQVQRAVRCAGARDLAQAGTGAGVRERRERGRPPAGARPGGLGVGVARRRAHLGVPVGVHGHGEGQEPAGDGQHAWRVVGRVVLLDAIERPGQVRERPRPDGRGSRERPAETAHRGVGGRLAQRRPLGVGVVQPGHRHLNAVGRDRDRRGPVRGPKPRLAPPRDVAPHRRRAAAPAHQDRHAGRGLGLEPGRREGFPLGGQLTRVGRSRLDALASPGRDSTHDDEPWQTPHGPRLSASRRGGLRAARASGIAVPESPAQGSNPGSVGRCRSARAARRPPLRTLR